MMTFRERINEKRSLHGSQDYAEKEDYTHNMMMITFFSCKTAPSYPAVLWHSLIP